MKTLVKFDSSYIINIEESGGVLSMTLANGYMVSIRKVRLTKYDEYTYSCEVSYGGRLVGEVASGFDVEDSRVFACMISRVTKEHTVSEVADAISQYINA